MSMFSPLFNVFCASMMGIQSAGSFSVDNSLNSSDPLTIAVCEPGDTTKKKKVRITIATDKNGKSEIRNYEFNSSGKDFDLQNALKEAGEPDWKNFGEEPGISEETDGKRIKRTIVIDGKCDFKPGENGVFKFLEDGEVIELKDENGSITKFDKTRPHLDAKKLHIITKRITLDSLKGKLSLLNTDLDLDSFINATVQLKVDSFLSKSIVGTGDSMVRAFAFALPSNGEARANIKIIRSKKDVKSESKNDNANNCEGLMESKMQIFPNPSDGEFTIALDLLESSDVSIRVSDLSGKTVLEKNSFGNKGKFTKKLKIKEKGHFSVQVKAGKKLYNEIIIIE